MDLPKQFPNMRKRELPPAACCFNTAALSSALMAALLPTTLFFLFALLTFPFLSIAILLPALSGRRGFVRFVWILLCVHDAFL